MKRRILLGAGAAFVALPALAASAPRQRGPRPTQRSAVGRIRAAGVLKVSVVQQFPWASLNPSQQWGGYDIDVCKRIADDLDVKPAFIDSAWNGAADDVAQGTSDIAASLQPTPRRALVVNFTRAYGTSQATLVANRDKAAGLTTLAAFNQPNVVIGVRERSQGERIARELLNRAEIRVLKDEVEALRALEAGELNAMVAVSPLPEILAARSPGRLVQPLAQPLRRRSEALAVRVEDIDLLTYLNTWIGYYEETGWLEERRQYWFGNGAKSAG